MWFWTQQWILPKKRCIRLIARGRRILILRGATQIPILLDGTVFNSTIPPGNPLQRDRLLRSRNRPRLASIACECLRFLFRAWFRTCAWQVSLRRAFSATSMVARRFVAICHRSHFPRFSRRGPLSPDQSASGVASSPLLYQYSRETPPT